MAPTAFPDSQSGAGSTIRQGPNWQEAQLQKRNPHGRAGHHQSISREPEQIQTGGLAENSQAPSPLHQDKLKAPLQARPQRCPRLQPTGGHQIRPTNFVSFYRPPNRATVHHHRSANCRAKTTPQCRAPSFRLSKSPHTHWCLSPVASPRQPRAALLCRRPRAKPHAPPA